jgi:hypothetical protein
LTHIGDEFLLLPHLEAVDILCKEIFFFCFWGGCNTEILQQAGQSFLPPLVFAAWLSNIVDTSLQLRFLNGSWKSNT